LQFIFFPKSFNLQIGGVPRYQSPRAFFRSKRALDSYYGTSLPPILGYMRGVRVGNEDIDLKNDGVRPLDPGKFRHFSGVNLL
jgi:hypothetical protein